MCLVNGRKSRLEWRFFDHLGTTRAWPVGPVACRPLNPLNKLNIGKLCSGQIVFTRNCFPSECPVIKIDDLRGYAHQIQDGPLTLVGFHAVSWIVLVRGILPLTSGLFKNHIKNFNKVLRILAIRFIHCSLVKLSFYTKEGFLPRLYPVQYAV